MYKYSRKFSAILIVFRLKLACISQIHRSIDVKFCGEVTSILKLLRADMLADENADKNRAENICICFLFAKSIVNLPNTVFVFIKLPSARTLNLGTRWR